MRSILTHLPRIISTVLLVSSTVYLSYQESKEVTVSAQPKPQVKPTKPQQQAAAVDVSPLTPQQQQHAVDVSPLIPQQQQHAVDVSPLIPQQQQHAVDVSPLIPQQQQHAVDVSSLIPQQQQHAVDVSHLTPQQQHAVDVSPLTPQQRYTKSVCRRHGRPTTLEVIEPELLTHFVVDDKYKIIYCQIPKVATTTWRRLFLVLTGKVGTSNPMALSANAVHHDLGKHLTYLSDLPEKEIRSRLKTYFKFLFVREPFERVLSAFRNKFDHFLETKNVIQSRFERPLINHYRKNKTNVQGDPTRVTFPEFIDYLVDPDPYIPSNEHWEQFYKLCHPCVIDYDFIGKLESIEKDSDFVIRKKGLDKIIKFPTRKEARYAKKRTNAHLNDYYSRISKTKLKQFWDAYREDFDIFNYTVPKEVSDLM